MGGLPYTVFDDHLSLVCRCYIVKAWIQIVVMQYDKNVTSKFVLIDLSLFLLFVLLQYYSLYSLSTAFHLHYVLYYPGRPNLDLLIKILMQYCTCTSLYNIKDTSDSKQIIKTANCQEIKHRQEAQKHRHIHTYFLSNRNRVWQSNEKMNLLIYVPSIVLLSKFSVNVDWTKTSHIFDLVDHDWNWCSLGSLADVYFNISNLNHIHPACNLKC